MKANKKFHSCAIENLLYDQALGFLNNLTRMRPSSISTDAGKEVKKPAPKTTPATPTDKTA